MWWRGVNEYCRRLWVKAYAIPGGSEEIMLNLAAGQFGFITRAAPDPRDRKIKALQEELKRIKSKM